MTIIENEHVTEIYIDESGKEHVFEDGEELLQ